MRLEKLDFLRWIAIILMVIFHLNYVLVNIFWVVYINKFPYLWFLVWKIAAILFIFISWISFYLAFKKYDKKIYKKYLKIIFILSIIAFFISFFTYVFINSQYIRFWIIHFFALSFFLLLFFYRFKYYNILIWLFFIIYWAFFIPIIENKYFYFLWFMYSWFKSADYYPIFPYFWIILLWYSFWLYLWDAWKLNLLKSKNNWNIFTKKVEYLWKNSLIIYLIHVPIIVLIIYIIIKIF